MAIVRPVTKSYDIVLMGNMTTYGDFGLRIAQEVASNFELGYRTGLYHLATGDAGRRIAPDIQNSVRSGIVSVVGPGSIVSTKLLVNHSVGSRADTICAPPTILADRTVLVLHRQSQVENLGRDVVDVSERLSVAPVNSWIRSALVNANLSIPLEAENWEPASRPAPTRRPLPRRINPRPTIGWISGEDNNEWPDALSDLKRILPSDGLVEVCILGDPPAHLVPNANGSPPWSIYKPGEVSIERFLSLVDILVYFPKGRPDSLPDVALHAAIAMGNTVILPSTLSQHFGEAAQYCEVSGINDAIRTSINRAEATKGGLRRSASRADAAAFAGRYKNRIESLTRTPSSQRKRRAPRIQDRGKPKALLIPSNGVGLGHVSRVLAIARHANDKFVPIIVTLSQAVPAIENFGYHTEYIPSQAASGAEPRLWDVWFSTELERLIDRYDARLIAFDGSNAPYGLVRAVAGRSDCKLVWIRRGMWGDSHTKLLDNARWFDAIIEPGEIAAAYDTGITARLFDRVERVPPVRLLDSNDLLSRKKAASALGLDESKPSVLVQIGAAVGGGVGTLVDNIIRELQKFPSLQIVIGEWMTSREPVSLWPGVKVIRGFPLSLYFNAFDFSVAEAGYNTFHDVISFELPTIFVPNTSRGRDDQRARARFAQESGAGFELLADSLSDMAEIVEVLMIGGARDIMRARCRQITQANGAVDATNALVALLS